MPDGFVPDDIKKRLYDTAVEAASRMTRRRWPRLAKFVAWFHSDSESRARFGLALDRAFSAFLRSLEQRNAELAGAFRADLTIWRSPALHQALREILASPGADRSDEWRALQQLFAQRIPTLAQDAVLLDVTLQLLVSCLAAELCLLPEFREVYRFEFEKRAAQSTARIADHLAQMTDFARAGNAYPPITSLPASGALSGRSEDGPVHQLSAGTSGQEGLWTLAGAPSALATIVVVGPDTRRLALLPTNATPDYSYLEFFGDKDTILEASVFLARTHTAATITRYPASWLPSALRAMPLVVVGGPSDDDGVGGNRVARQIMDHYRLPFEYHEDCEGIDYRGTSYRTEVDTAGRITRDWGVVARLRNPWNIQMRVLLIQGIHTHGVLGAFRAITEGWLVPVADALGSLSSRDPLFTALVRVEVIDGVVASTRLEPSFVHGCEDT